jgi:hypothetical protein
MNTVRNTPSWQAARDGKARDERPGYFAFAPCSGAHTRLACELINALAATSIDDPIRAALRERVIEAWLPLTEAQRQYEDVGGVERIAIGASRFQEGPRGVAVP